MIKYLLLVVAIVATENIQAKSKKNKTEEAKIDFSFSEDKKNDFKSIQEVTEKLKKVDGLFPMYQDSLTGKS